MQDDEEAKRIIAAFDDLFNGAVAAADPLTEGLHLLLCREGLSLRQHPASWADVRTCLRSRGSLGPLRWRYPSQWGGEAHCQLQVFAPAGAPPLLLVTEEEDNPGTSVTHAAALLVGELMAALDLDVRAVRFVECYTVPIGDLPPPRFATVTFEYCSSGRSVRWEAPQWQHLPLASEAAVADAAAALPAAARNLARRGLA